MLAKILHQMTKNPWVYDQIQYLVGAKQIHQRLAAHVATFTDVSSVLDLGGGTGLYHDLWPATCTHICLDMDRLKLQAYRHKHNSGLALCADATTVSFQSNSIDVVMCIFVSHHLPEAALDHMLAESHRVLKNTGIFILMDPIWNPKRFVGRLLWRYDVGSYPRTPQALRSIFSKYYQTTHDEFFSIYHSYFFCIGAKSMKNK